MTHETTRVYNTRTDSGNGRNSKQNSGQFLEDALNLTNFQISQLAVAAGEPNSGQEIRDALNAIYDTEITHGRLYPNLDTLVNKGLVGKDDRDRRTHEYPVTTRGNATLRKYADWLDTAVDDVHGYSDDTLAEAVGLTHFQIALLVEADGDRRSGQEIKDALEDIYGCEINHGRLYPNLDTLVDKGLVEKGELDRRTNYYKLTDDGRDVTSARRQWVLEQIAADGGEQ